MQHRRPAFPYGKRAAAVYSPCYARCRTHGVCRQRDRAPQRAKRTFARERRRAPMPRYFSCAILFVETKACASLGAPSSTPSHAPSVSNSFGSSSPESRRARRRAPARRISAAYATVNTPATTWAQEAARDDAHDRRGARDARFGSAVRVDDHGGNRPDHGNEAIQKRSPANRASRILDMCCGKPLRA